MSDATFLAECSRRKLKAVISKEKTGLYGIIPAQPYIVVLTDKGLAGHLVPRNDGKGQQPETMLLGKPRDEGFARLPDRAVTATA